MNAHVVLAESCVLKSAESRSERNVVSRRRAVASSRFISRHVVSELGLNATPAKIVEVRSRLSHILVGCLAAIGCRDVFEPEFPPSAVAVPAPPEYRVWWEVVESCSGRTAPFNTVTWYRAPIGSGLSVNGESAAGAWFVSGNRIVIGDGWKGSGPLVRHEILHAILRTGLHPREQFRGSCEDEVICGRDCTTEMVLPGAILLPVERLEVSAELFPESPSLRRDLGRATVVVRARNPLSVNAYVSAQRFAEASCPFGFVLTSVADPDLADWDCRYFAYSPSDARVYFRPGETRRIVFELDLRVHFGAGPVTLGAVLLDQVQGKTEVVIQP
jgi:hypothetical protein